MFLYHKLCINYHVLHVVVVLKKTYFKNDIDIFIYKITEQIRKGLNKTLQN